MPYRMFAELDIWEGPNCIEYIVHTRHKKDVNVLSKCEKVKQAKLVVSNNGIVAAWQERFEGKKRSRLFVLDLQ